MILDPLSVYMHELTWRLDSTSFLSSTLSVAFLPVPCQVRVASFNIHSCWFVIYRCGKELYFCQINWSIYFILWNSKVFWRPNCFTIISPSLSWLELQQVWWILRGSKNISFSHDTCSEVSRNITFKSESVQVVLPQMRYFLPDFTKDCWGPDAYLDTKIGQIELWHTFM